MILANIYIDRLLHNRHFTITSLNVRHLLLAALLVATKFIDDSYPSNGVFADAGLVSLDELNRMERVFLASIGYSLFVNSSQFMTYLNSFLVHVFCTNCSHCHQWMSLDSVGDSFNGCVGDSFNGCIRNSFNDYTTNSFNDYTTNSFSGHNTYSSYDNTYSSNYPHFIHTSFNDPVKSSMSFNHFKSPVSTCAEPFDYSFLALAPFPMEWNLHCPVCYHLSQSHIDSTNTQTTQTLRNTSQHLQKRPPLLLVRLSR